MIQSDGPFLRFDFCLSIRLSSVWCIGENAVPSAGNSLASESCTVIRCRRHLKRQAEERLSSEVVRFGMECQNGTALNVVTSGTRLIPRLKSPEGKLSPDITVVGNGLDTTMVAYAQRN